MLVHTQQKRIVCSPVQMNMCWQRITGQGIQVPREAEVSVWATRLPLAIVVQDIVRRDSVVALGWWVPQRERADTRSTVYLSQQLVCVQHWSIPSPPAVMVGR